MLFTIAANRGISRSNSNSMNNIGLSMCLLWWITAATVASAAAVDCPPNAAFIGGQGDTLYPELPITIIAQNTTSVSFRVDNTFASDVTSVFVQYRDNPSGNLECDRTDSVQPIDVSGPNPDMIYTAYCMRHVPVSLVTVWFLDDATFTLPGDDATAADCCDSTGVEDVSGAAYAFTLNCTAFCPQESNDGTETNTRKLDDEFVAVGSQREEEMTTSTVTTIDDGNHHRPSTTDVDVSDFHHMISQMTTQEPSSSMMMNTIDFVNHHPHYQPTGVYCSSRDHPCNDDENDNDEENGTKVHVCHYSSFDEEYHTYCLSELESDIFFIYPNDYCGPCLV